MWVAVAVCSSGHVAADVPAGVYALTPARQSLDPEILERRAVSAIILRSDWVDVEPEQGRFDWRYLDEQMTKVARAGKAASLVVTTGGKQVPAWLLPRLGEPFRFTDSVRFHATYGQVVSIPVFWDPALLEHRRRFIAALGERYAAQPALKLVSVQCANATTDDWNIPGSPEDVAAWLRLGFTPARLLEACRSMLDATAAAFPGKVLRMAVGRVPPGLLGAPGSGAQGEADGDPDSVARALIRYANARWPGRFVVQRHNLSARTPGPKDPRAGGWRLVADACPACAAQFLWPAVDTRSCRANGGQQPCEARAMFRAAADTALAYGLRYVEVYTSDLREPALREEVDRLALGLAGAQPVGMAEPPASATVADLPSGDGTAGVRHLEFHSAAYGRARRFGLWLPPSYANGQKRYPVLYWLHGKGGDPRRSAHVVQYLQQAIREGRIPETIMVWPDGDSDRFYSDSVDGRTPVESMIIRDLVPYIDTHFRTIASPRGRLIEGFSMGGFGALKLAAKYPDLFGSVVAYGAPRLDANLGMGGADAAIFREVFGGDMEKFRRETPVWLFAAGADRIRASGLKIRIVAGSDDGTRHSVLRLHEALVRLGIAHEYEVLPGVRHAPGLYYEADRGAGFDLHRRSVAER